MRDLQYTDTDNYYCRFVGTETTDVPGNVSSTYLFARDEKYLMDGSHRFIFFNVPQYTESVIPCRPTDPAVNMSFVKDGHDITANLAAHFFKYDPKRGLVITRGTMKFHVGMLACIARRGEQEEKFSAILNFQRVEKPPPPQILDQVSKNFLRLFQLI